MCSALQMITYFHWKKKEDIRKVKNIMGSCYLSKIIYMMTRKVI